jgi:RNA polymerase sigma-70 factor (ECF subfamily)
MESLDSQGNGAEPLDAELATRAVHADPEAFHLIMRRCNRTLFRTARSILKDDDEAQDAVQEAYLSAFRAMRDFRGEAALRTWLVRIVVNQALRQLRRNKRRAGLICLGDEVPPPPAHASLADAAPERPEEAAVRGQIRRLLETAVDALPDEFRTAFVLREVEGFSVEETASALGIARATVRTRCFRAKSLLRERLSSDGFDLASAFPFAGASCDRMIARVMARLQL